MRRYNQPATVDLGQDGVPVRFTAWDRDYAIAEVIEWWEEQQPWWTPENAAKPLPELRVVHWMVRAHGAQRSAVVELVQRAGGWRVEGVED